MFVIKHGNVGLTCLAFSPDGASLAAGGYRGTVLLWDLAAKRLRCNADRVSADEHSEVAFVADMLLTLSNWEVHAFDAATGAWWGDWPARPLYGALRSMAAGAGLLVTAPWDYAKQRATVFGYALPDGVKRWRASRDVDGPLITALATDGRLVAAGTAYGAVHVLDAATGRRRHDARSSGFTEVKAIALAPGGGSVAWVAGASVYRWRLTPGPGEVTRAGLGRTHFLGVAWHPSGGFFATANGDGKVDYWDALTGDRRESFDWGVGKLHDVAFDATGDRAACCSKTGEVVVWDVDR